MNVVTADLHIVPLPGSVSFVGVQVYRAKQLLKLVFFTLINGQTIDCMVDLVGNTMLFKKK